MAIAGETPVLAFLAGLPGIAALGLALLYAIGATIVTADLIGAGLSVGATLALIPLEQILARGVGTALLVSVVVPALVVALVMLALLEKRGRRRAEDEARAADELIEEFEQLGREANIPIGRAQELVARLNDLTHLAASQERDRKAEELAGEAERVVAESEARFGAIDVRLQQAQAGARRLSTNRRRRLRALWWANLVGLLTVVVLSVLAPVEVVAASIVGLPAIYLFRRFRPGSPLLGGYVIAMSVSTVVVLGLAFLVPRPLATAQLRLTDGRLVVGARVVVLTSENWVLTRRPRTIEVVPIGLLRTATVEQSPGRDPVSVLELVTTWNSPLT